MSSEPPILPTREDAIATIRTEIAGTASTKRERITLKFLMAALGSIPWIGGVLSALASIPSDERAAHGDDLRTRWLEEHQAKFTRLKQTLEGISERFERLGPTIAERIQDAEYLALVRQSFRAWDRAETDEKRRYVANLITNAAGSTLTSDDVVRLFVGWLETYHEAHFAVIREIFREPGLTRFEIWTRVHGEIPREDSAEADLFRLLIRDLSTGGVIRQPRDTNEEGQFLRRPSRRRSARVPSTMESAFEDTKPYVLTELGKQFVHYALTEVVPRLDSTSEVTGQERPKSDEPD